MKLLLFLPFLFCVNVTSQPKPLVPAELNDPSQSYGDCTIRTNRGCIGVSDKVDDKDCLSSQTCYILVTYRTSEVQNLWEPNSSPTGTSGRVHFQVFSPHFSADAPDRYIAIGISEDERMGDDTVVACINYRGNLHIQLSYNDGYVNFIEPVIPSKPSQLVGESITVLNNQIRCSFSLPTAFTVSNLDRSLDTAHYQLLLAHGHPISLDTLENHNYRYSYLDRKINFTAVEAHKGTAENQDTIHLAITIHAILMTLTFITCIPTTTMISRFLKESHVTFRIAHRKFWFISHIFLSTFGFACMIIGLAIIFYAFGLVPKVNVIPFRNHYIIGFAVTAVYAGQMTLGAFLNVYYIDSYNWIREIGARVHFGAGVALYLIGLVQLFLVPYYLPSILRFCSIGSILVSFWLLLHVIFFGIASIIMWRSDTAEFKSLEHRESIDFEEIRESDEINNLESNPESNSTKSERSVHRKKVDTSPMLSNEKAAERQLQPRTINTSRPSSGSYTSSKSGSTKSATRSAGLHKKSNARPVRVSKLAKTRADIESEDIKSKKKSVTSQKRSQVGEQIGVKAKGSIALSKKSQTPIVKRSSKTNSTAGLNLLSTKSPATKNTASRDRSNNTSNLNPARRNTPSTNVATNRRKSQRKSTIRPEEPSGKQLELEFDNKKGASSVAPMVDSIGPDPETEAEPDSANLEKTEKTIKGSHGHEGQKRKAIEIVHQKKEVIYDDFPEYEMETVGLEVIQRFRRATKVLSKRMKKDPLRAFKSFPMKVYFTREYPKTAQTDVVLAIFFATSLCMSAGIVYSMTPYGNKDNCNDKTWMVKFP